MHTTAPASAGPAVDIVPIRRVLVSVFDKTGLDRLAKALKAAGVHVASTGGTSTALASHGVAVEDVSSITGFPEVLDGRVKTLHPHIFAGILARGDRPDDLAVLEEHGIERFDAVIVNLYAFETAIAKPGCQPAEAIELIDIGGPSLVRAAAKNHAFTTVVTSPDQYDDFLHAVARGGTTLAERRHYAARAFEHTASYDTAIAGWMARHAGLVAESATPAVGEPSGEPPLAARLTLDLDGAMRLVGLVTEPAAVVVKHTNPCGAAGAASVSTALATAMAADPTSAFGSIVAVNRTFDRACAEVLLAPGMFVEVIAAPAFEKEAVELLTTKPTWKASVRLVEIPPGDPWEATGGMELRSVAGALLAQRPDTCCDDPAAWKVVTKAAPAADLTQPLGFAFTLVRRLTSNAIAVCQGTSLVGAGIGQTSRVDATRIALEKAGDRARGGVLASDAFFPFPDSIELIKRAGIAAIIQPGGSKRDAEVIAAADAAGIPMVFTARRHFRH